MCKWLVHIYNLFFKLGCLSIHINDHPFQQPGAIPKSIDGLGDRIKFCQYCFSDKEI